LVSGKNSAGVSVGDGEEDVDLSGEALEVFAGWAAGSACSFCASGISPTRCFTRANQEQPNTSEKNGALSLTKSHKRRHSNGRLAWGARRKKIEL